MADYSKQIGKTGARFASGNPVVLSPQLEDYEDSAIRHVSLSGEDVRFRVALYVRNFETSDVAFDFKEDNVLEVRMQHPYKPLPMYKSGTLVASRDCTYYYKLPSTEQQDLITATWTEDGFLVIEYRKVQGEPPMEGQDPYEKSFKQDLHAGKVVPIHSRMVLRPELDYAYLMSSSDELRASSASLDTYLTMSNRDILNLQTL